jgi:hypothetical protein
MTAATLTRLTTIQMQTAMTKTAVTVPAIFAVKMMTVARAQMINAKRRIVYLAPHRQELPTCSF